MSTLRPAHLNQHLAEFVKVYAKHRPVVQRILTTSFVLYVLGTTYRGLAARPSVSSSVSKKGRGRSNGKEHGNPRVAVRYLSSSVFHRRDRVIQVDALFYHRLSTILRIVIPSIRSKEALLLVMHSSLLIFRTAISLYVAALDGKCVLVLVCPFPVYTLRYYPEFISSISERFISRIVASLVRGQTLQFSLNILRWLVVAIPATWTNSWLSYVQSKLAIAYRTRLTEEIMKQYLGAEAEGPDGKVYYKLCEGGLFCFTSQ